MKTTEEYTAASSSRIIEFDASGEGKIGPEIHTEDWDWPGILRLFDEVLPLSAKKETTDSNDPNAQHKSMARSLYPYLPNGQGDLRTIRKNAKKYYRLAKRSPTPETREALSLYRRQLEALALAARQKLSVVCCQVNKRNWDKRAYRFYQELQLNLGKFRQIHFLTLTFTGDLNYKEVRKLLKDFTGNHLYRNDFESVEIVAFHPSPDAPGRLHVHLLAWSKHPRSLRDEKKALTELFSAVKRAKRGIGFTNCKSVSGVAEVLKTAAYLAFNYSQTVKLAKGPENPIPKGARLLSRPQSVLPGQAWKSVGKIALVTPSTTEWRKAVARFAEVHGLSPAGDRRWIWWRRRSIRRYLEPETWWEASVTGLDGYTYRVIPAGEDHFGNETYLLSSDERGGFYLTDHGLRELANFEVMAEAVPKNSKLDLTTGETANCYEVLGFYALVKKRSA